MAVKLVEATRGGMAESISRGDIAVADGEGRLIYYAGDPSKYTFMRSAAKPLQAMEVFISGAAHYYGLNTRETAVICASHYGEPMHRNAVESILHKTGLDQRHLLCGTVTSLKSSYALQLAREGMQLNPLFSDCSGKHAGMLAVCRYKGYPLNNYTSAEHPLQQEITQLIADLCRYPEKDIALGIDGCSVPVHALPLLNMARGYARLTAPDQLPDGQQKAARDITDAMTRHPEMVAGTGGFCSDLMRNTQGKLIGKIGAEGVYCIGIRNNNTGMAVKLEDGNMNRLPPVVIEVLKQLNVLTQKELKALDDYHVMDTLNDVGQKVGSIRPVFRLKRVQQS